MLHGFLLGLREGDLSLWLGMTFANLKKLVDWEYIGFKYVMPLQGCGCAGSSLPQIVSGASGLPGATLRTNPFGCANPALNKLRSSGAFSTRKERAAEREN